MSVKTTTLTYPEGLPQALKVSDEAFASELRLLAAAKLFELGRVSSGVAAEIAGMSRVEFLHSLGQYGIAAINLRDEEVTAEVEAGRSLVP
jgi:predicted HTH domain antitoxin